MAVEDVLGPGTVVAGRYRVTKKLGQGGMGVVFAAADTMLKRHVAIKYLAPALAADPANVVRFRREARAAAQLKSEHVVRIHDVDELPQRLPYMVMELLDGQDLAWVLRAQSRVGPGRAVEWILQAAEAVAEAHSRGTIHRDIKPQNLFLTKRADGSDLVKVLDFGLAKAPPGKDERKLTKPAETMGSPEYMSPEQARGADDLDARTDVWALGATLYELVTGKTPFAARTPMEAMMKILEEAPTPPRELAPNVPPALANAIMRALEKDRAQRYADVAELAEAIAPFAPIGSPTAMRNVRRVLEATHSNSNNSVAVIEAAAAAVERAQLEYGKTVFDPNEAKTLIDPPRPKKKKHREPPLPLVIGAVVIAVGVGVVALLVALGIL